MLMNSPPHPPSFYVVFVKSVLISNPLLKNGESTLVYYNIKYRKKKNLKNLTLEQVAVIKKDSTW